MFNYDMIAKIYPVAFAASQGLDFHHDGSDKQFYGSRIDTNYLNYQNQDCGVRVGDGAHFNSRWSLRQSQ